MAMSLKRHGKVTWTPAHWSTGSGGYRRSPAWSWKIRR